MTAKQTLSVRVSAEKLESLKKEALAQNKTVNDLIFEALDGSAAQYQLRQKVQDQDVKIQFMQDKLESLTGNKPKFQKRVSVPVTLEQSAKIKISAAQQNIPQGQLLNKMIFGAAATAGQKALT